MILYIYLHFFLMLFSTCGIFSKKAAGVPFLSFRFCLCYAAIILLLGVYAIGWQQIIKHLPLTTAYANKAVTVFWGLVIGKIVFKEELTIGKIIGAVVVISGVVLYSLSDNGVKTDG